MNHHCDELSASVGATQHSLSVKLTLTGGSCPSNTAVLDTALSTWFKAQADSAYTCYKDGTCNVGSGSQCKDESGGVVYSFSLLQTKKLESNREFLTKL